MCVSVSLDDFVMKNYLRIQLANTKSIFSFMVTSYVCQQLADYDSQPRMRDEYTLRPSCVNIKKGKLRDNIEFE